MSTPWLRKSVIAVALLGLLAGLLYARLAPGPDLTPAIMATLETGERLDPGERYRPIMDASGAHVGFLAVATRPGYGGPLTVAVRLDREGRLVAVTPIDHKETPGFFLSVARSGLLEQFRGLKANAPMQLGADLQGVSGATITSRAIAEAARLGAYEVARTEFGLATPQSKLEITFGLEEWALLGMMLLSLALWKLNLTRLRLPLLALSTVVMGFWLGALFAIPQLTALLMGYAPPLQEAVRWYLLVAGVLILTVTVGHNWYCYWLCPFGAAQELLSLVGGNMIRPSLRLRRALSWIRWALLWLSAMVAFFTLSPGTGSVEPFSTLFLFKGSNLQWVVLLTVLVSAIFVKRIWCNFLCPVGAFREAVDWLRREVMTRWRAKTRPDITT
ncbi:MAG: 4Fe-4S binding protein [Bacillota bacterium]